MTNNAHIERHHRFGDRRCVPCGVNKERFEKEGCSTADCPWRAPPRTSPEELEARYAHFMPWRTRHG